jgi:hypothetical protein
VAAQTTEQTAKPASAVLQAASSSSNIPQLQQQQQHEPDDDVSIFSVTKVKTTDGKIEVMLKPLPALQSSTSTAVGPKPQSAPTAASASAAAAAGSAAASTAAAAAVAAATQKACAKPELSSHEADIVFLAGNSGLSVTTLSASCAAAAPASSTLGGGCSVKCDLEEDLAKITLVRERNMTEAKQGAEKPAVCR